ncbi:MAG TPA: hypothetical protein VFX53_05095 [Pedococcus sp.]|nr:hypothetical protein [Pedococcus sp.]
MTEYGPAVENDPRMKTADGAIITDGGTYWNYYDCEWIEVDFESSKPGEPSQHSRGPDGDYWDGWFTVHSVEGGRGRYTLNGERMSRAPRQ